MIIYSCKYRINYFDCYLLAEDVSDLISTFLHANLGYIGPAIRIVW